MDEWGTFFGFIHLIASFYYYLTERIIIHAFLHVFTHNSSVLFVQVFLCNRKYMGKKKNITRQKFPLSHFWLHNQHGTVMGNDV